MLSSTSSLIRKSDYLDVVEDLYSAYPSYQCRWDSFLYPVNIFIIKPVSTFYNSGLKDHHRMKIGTYSRAQHVEYIPTYCA